jgi:uncharacterized membrane-anchored protein
MLKAIVLAAGLIAAAPLAAWAQSDPPLTPDQQKTVEKFRAIVAEEHPQHGDISIPAANTTLHLGDSYYFLNADEARRVIVDGWNNPPDNARGVLGIIFPKDTQFFNSWGAIVTYETTGHVADDDAKDADYGKLLQQAQQGEDDLNQTRQKGGFPAIHLVGWAQAPTYDPATHSEVWARQIRFTGQDVDTLNYDTRILGRTGVLSLNLVSTMDQLQQARVAANDLARTASFNPGARYEDFQKGQDKAAGYGVAGLVAAGLGVAVAKKFGLLALILLFAKKGIVLLAAAGAWIASRFRKLTGRDKKPKPAPGPLILTGAEPPSDGGPPSA